MARPWAQLLRHVEQEAAKEDGDMGVFTLHGKPTIEEAKRNEERYRGEAERTEELERPVGALQEETDNLPPPTMDEMPEPDGPVLPVPLRIELVARQNIALELLRYRDFENPLKHMTKALEDTISMVAAELKLPDALKIVFESELTELHRKMDLLMRQTTLALEQDKAPLL